jgi:hypothetical protein
MNVLQRLKLATYEGLRDFVQRKNMRNNPLDQSGVLSR